MLMNTPKPDIQAKLQALREAYARQLPSKLQSLVQAWKMLTENNWNWDNAAELYRELHTLAGSAPTFGFAELGQQANAAEQLLKIWVTEQVAPEVEPRQQLGIMLEKLGAELAPARYTSTSDGDPAPLPGIKKDSRTGLLKHTKIKK